LDVRVGIGSTWINMQSDLGATFSSIPLTLAYSQGLRFHAKMVGQVNHMGQSKYVGLTCTQLALETEKRNCFVAINNVPLFGLAEHQKFGVVSDAVNGKMYAVEQNRPFVERKLVGYTVEDFEKILATAPADDKCGALEISWLCAEVYNKGLKELPRNTKIPSQEELRDYFRTIYGVTAFSFVLESFGAPPIKPFKTSDLPQWLKDPEYVKMALSVSEEVREEMQRARDATPPLKVFGPALALEATIAEREHDRAEREHARAEQYYHMLKQLGHV